MMTGVMDGSVGARSSGRSVQDYLGADVVAAPEVLRRESGAFLGSEDIDRSRYVTREFHDREVERVWKRVWQVACRVEDIPEVGDHVVYDVADSSVIVVRSGPDEFHAFHNACLHRGARLRDGDGSVRQFRCPFHGFTWDLCGRLTDVPCRWDFPHVDDEKFRLPQVLVGTWGGFVFINMDPDAEPLTSYLGGLPDHFANLAFPLERRFKAVHVAKVVPCNWKACLEAFLESYHVIATHPNLMPYTADSNTQYDVYPDDPNFTRMITGFGVPSPHLGDEVDEQDILTAIMRDLYPEAPEGAMVPEGMTARQVAAAGVRSMLSTQTGVDLSGISDCEAVDAIQYHLFPNLVPWGGLGAPICYRVRPHGNDVDSAIFEVMLLLPYPGETPPRGVPVHWLSPEDDWSAAPELGGLCPVFDQDQQNLPRLQTGMKASVKPGITLGNYQESRIRAFHQWLDKKLA